MRYLQSSFRSLLKNKVFTLINILGLSIGTCAALMIYLIVQYDLTFDRFEPARDRIYRLVSHGDPWQNQGVPSPAHLALQQVPGIENITPLFNAYGVKVSIPHGNSQATTVFKQQDKVVFTDGHYFALFPRKWLAGGPATSLQKPNQLVLSETRAKTYFPGLAVEQMIGQTVVINDSLSMVLTGVVEDLEAKTDFDNEVFIAVSTIPATGLVNSFNWTDWNSTSSSTQVLFELSPSVSPKKVERQIASTFKPLVAKDSRIVFPLQPLADIHFNTELDGKVEKSTLTNLSLLAVFILFLGAINFINLATAQASKRAKEIGMRKLLGSSKGMLIKQFMLETFLLTALTTVLSVMVTPLLLKGFAHFLPGGLAQQGIWQAHVLVFLLILIVVVGALAGFYPAFVLTSFDPLSVTKNQPVSTSGNNRSVWLRKTLTVSQFVIAQVFIIGTLVVKNQIHYSLQKDMGFRKEAIINFYVPIDFAHPDNKKFVLRDQLKTIPEIEAVSLGNQSPAFGGFMTSELTYKDGKKEIKMSPDVRDGDTNFISLYHIKLLAGRNVLPTDDATEYLINETMARQLGFAHPADAIGHFLDQGAKPMPIVGVMADFNLTSVRTAIHPVIFYSDRTFGYVMHVALRRSMDTWKAAIAKMQADWKAVYPGQDFNYTFLDKSIESFYQEDQKLSSLLSWATGVAILISCLGLLGLVIFTANQRTKEIGIRKVLGASVVQIIALLSTEFVWLVALAFVLAVPVSWWLMHRWLQDFAYHAPLQWWIFVVGGVSMLIISLLILSLRAGKAALANPVQSLRSE
jgi:putative ABC transport system permease protein